MNTLRLHRLVAASALGVLIVAAGCGSGTKVHPVEGSIQAGGRPLPFGVVTFNPDAEKGNKANQAGIGQLDSSGNYRIAVNGVSGLPAGWYRVTVATNLPGQTPPAGVQLPAIPATYTDAANTPWRVEVVEKPEADRYKLVVP